MCERIVIDTDRMHLVFPDKPPKKRDKLLRTWIENGYGTPCYTTYGKYGEELDDVLQYKELLGSLQDAGRAHLVSSDEMVGAMEELIHSPQWYKDKKNDDHVLSLIIASKAKILCTGDKRLKGRFRKIIPRIATKETVLYPEDKDASERELFLKRNQCQK